MTKTIYEYGERAIYKLGKSLAIVIPHRIAQKYGLKARDKAEVRLEGDEMIIRMGKRKE